MGLGPSFPTTPKAIPKTPSRLTRTKTPSKYFRSTSPTTSSVIVEVSSIKKEEDAIRKDSVELSMDEKRKLGGQEAAAEKLRSRLSHLQKRKDEDLHSSILAKISGTSKTADVESFMSRFPYKSCQRSVISDLRRKRSLSLPR